MAALEESPATVAEGHTVSEMQACMTLSGAAQNCGLGWPKLFQLLPSFSPCTLNIRPVAKTPVSQFCSQGAITKMVEEVGRSYPCPAAPVPRPWEPLCFPSPRPLGFVEQKRASACHPFIKKSLLSPQGVSKMGFCA